MTSTVQSTELELAAVANAADRVAAFASRTGRPHLVDDDLVAAWLGPRGFFTNYAIVRQDQTDGWRSVADRLEALVPSASPALVATPFEGGRQLGALGFVEVGEPPLLVREVGAADAPVMAPELQIHEIVDEAGLEVYERTIVDGYPDPSMQPYEWGGFLHERMLGGSTRFWVGYVDGRPVATAWAHTACGVNQVEAVATLPGFRGRGYGAAVTWAATTADPSLPACLIASDLGRPVYERLGYQLVRRWQLWIRPPAG